MKIKSLKNYTCYIYLIRNENIYTSDTKKGDVAM